MEFADGGPAGAPARTPHYAALFAPMALTRMSCTHSTRAQAERRAGSRAHACVFLARRAPKTVPSWLFDPRIFRRDTRMEYRSWMCLICGWIYDEEAGLPEEGIAPGTRWEDVPINWTCPECGARKEDFEMVQI